MRISDWSSDVCSSDLRDFVQQGSCRWQTIFGKVLENAIDERFIAAQQGTLRSALQRRGGLPEIPALPPDGPRRGGSGGDRALAVPQRSEEHTSELQSLMRISYAVFCLKKKK